MAEWAESVGPEGVAAASRRWEEVLRSSNREEAERRFRNTMAEWTESVGPEGVAAASRRWGEELRMSVTRLREGLNA